MRLVRRVSPAALLIAALAGCGSSSSSSTITTPAAPASASTGAAAAHSGATPQPAELVAAEHPVGSAFPPATGRTLVSLARAARAQVQLGLATGTFTPGTDRVAFALSTSAGELLYAPTALYIAASPSAPARGPFPAPADSTTVAPRYRSAQNAGPGGLQAVYETELPLPAARTYSVLALTRTGSGLVAATGELAVARSTPIPNVGDRAPSVETDTPASVHGDVSLLSTRIPPDDMHAVSLRDVLGKRPVALLFSTPQLCQSRVCGPVTDVVVSLEPAFRNRLDFIHEEVYVGNQPSHGLRPQMRAFGLQTEPWLFTIDRHGVIAARLEGTFGSDAVTRALKAALR